MNCRRRQFAVGYSRVWQLLGEEGQLLRKGRENWWLLLLLWGLKGRGGGGRRQKERMGVPKMGSSPPQLEELDYCGQIYICSALLQVQLSHDWLSLCVLQTPILLTPSPLLSSIHFWSTLSPVAPLSPARLQGANTLFQVSSSKFSPSLPLSHTCQCFPQKTCRDLLAQESDGKFGQ